MSCHAAAAAVAVSVMFVLVVDQLLSRSCVVAGLRDGNRREAATSSRTSLRHSV